ncbi:hypothetical protein RhiirA5_437535 [Rhizophagus irregularis]|uniref:Uncharacterized protein n=1 Tax=Rhizophagus irregularis TaxID=588596 RepID=A0A2N0NKC4_9GLOM|nr:hypothetical protein RhiirA5_437535 [Rhizophagus irregularis]
MVARLHDTYYDAKATLLSEADIKEIRESRGKIPNASKKMADKFHIGPKRVYEIWDNKKHLQRTPDISKTGHKYPGSCLQQGVISFSSGQPVLDENSQTNKIEQTEVEPSKSTDLASEGSVILGGKTKKTGGKKSKSVQISEPSSIQTQPISASKKDTSNMDALYEKMVEKSTKILDEKKKCYPENNLPIL